MQRLNIAQEKDTYHITNESSNKIELNFESGIVTMAFKKYLVALTIVGIVDAISYMLVTPSLVFYVLENGGAKTSTVSSCRPFRFPPFAQSR